MTIEPRKKSPPLYLLEDVEYFEARTKLAPTEAWVFKYLLQDMLPIEGGLHDEVYVGKKGTVFFTEEFASFFYNAENDYGGLFGIKRRMSRTDRERLELWAGIANWFTVGGGAVSKFPVMSQYFEEGGGEIFLDALLALGKYEVEGYDTLFGEFESKGDLDVRRLCREAEYPTGGGQLTMGDLGRVKDMLFKALVTDKASALKLFLEEVEDVNLTAEQEREEELEDDEDDWS
jgi:hypothetical protein